ncbi:MAG: type II toxin-antitoxin system Phd/YefM family antitoxin [Opitutaceae bacterium]|jgi:antitoxin (DNA-binding transcriptional repressor) of toxin-antitoxin stability system|nr:type II toxin-antitoxin system Phd/YefM family antitoxin [Opitutaceae bacterium]
MVTKDITVTEASRHFSETINRVVYNREILTLKRGNKIVARILPARRRSTGAALLKWIENQPPMTEEERKSFADDIEVGRKALNTPPVSKFDL